MQQSLFAHTENGKARSFSDVIVEILKTCGGTSFEFIDENIQ